MELQKDTKDAMNQFNNLFGSVLTFDESDMPKYDECYQNVFSKGVNMSYMSVIFFAQFSAEIFLGMLSSSQFRRFLIEALNDEIGRPDEQMKYWQSGMLEHRFGLPNVDYSKDKAEIMLMANDTYIKLASLCDWFSSDEGKAEFDMYCLSVKAIRDIKRIVCEYPYLIRRYDFDMQFANEIMEYAGIVANQIQNM